MLNFSSRNLLMVLYLQSSAWGCYKIMEFIPGLDPTNQASGKLNIGFTDPKG